jgi:uncharacterized protein YqcC (DUF446 family)
LTGKLYARVAHAIDEIEAEIKRIGYWSTEPLPEAAYQFQAAFAMDTMTFVQWLQFVFIPRVRDILAKQGTFPLQSMVGVQAMREFDGDEDASRLVLLLTKFDELFGRRRNPL